MPRTPKPRSKRAKAKLTVDELAWRLFQLRMDQCNMYEVSWNHAGSIMQRDFRDLAKMVKLLISERKL